METLTRNQIKLINQEVEVITGMLNVNLLLTEVEDFSGRKYQVLKSGNLISKLTQLQNVIYSDFWFEVIFNIIDEEIYCNLECKFNLNSGDSKGYALERFSIDVNLGL